MSRLYGRVEDVNSFYNYFIDNYNKKYVKDNTIISCDELQDSQKLILDYLYKDYIIYLNNCNVKCFYDKRSKDVAYNIEEGNNVIFFPTKDMKEEYKSDLIYYIGDLLNNRRLDYMTDEYDIRCQYGDLIPLLVQYLFFKESGKEDRFTSKNFEDLKSNVPIYKKVHDRSIKYPKIYTRDILLRHTLLNLVPLSSMDAALQIIDKYGNDKNEMRYLLGQLIINEHHNREEVVNEIGINTYGFKRLKKEIDLKK